MTRQAGGRKNNRYGISSLIRSVRPTWVFPCGPQHTTGNMQTVWNIGRDQELNGEEVELDLHL